jgi:hypothetical protein
VPNGRQRGAQPRVVGHLAVAQRHVEVLADQHALPGQVEVGHPSRISTRFPARSRSVIFSTVIVAFPACPALLSRR